MKLEIVNSLLSDEKLDLNEFNFIIELNKQAYIATDENVQRLVDLDLIERSYDKYITTDRCDELINEAAKLFSNTLRKSRTVITESDNEEYSDISNYILNEMEYFYVGRHDLKKTVHNFWIKSNDVFLNAIDVRAKNVSFTVYKPNQTIIDMFIKHGATHKVGKQRHIFSIDSNIELVIEITEALSNILLGFYDV